MEWWIGKMPTEKFDGIIKLYKIFLAIIVGASLILFNFWVGETIEFFPIEFAYYLSGLIVGIAVTLVVINIYKGLNFIEEKI
jgi:hypothetical protein